MSMKTIDETDKVAQRSEKLLFSFVAILGCCYFLSFMSICSYLYGSMHFVMMEAIFPIGRMLGIFAFFIPVLATIWALMFGGKMAIAIFALLGTTLPLALNYGAFTIALSSNTQFLVDGFQTEVMNLDKEGEYLLREDIEQAQRLYEQGEHIGIPFVANKYTWNIDRARDGELDVTTFVMPDPE